MKVKNKLAKNRTLRVPRGRPCLLTHKRMEILLKGIKNGMPLKHAAMLAGISYDTLNRWRKMGAEENAALEFRHFCKALERSQAVGMQRLVVRIHKAARKDWKAASWMLERRYPEDFGRPENDSPQKLKRKPVFEESPITHDVLQRMKKQSSIVELTGRLGQELIKARAKRLEREAKEKKEILNSMSNKKTITKRQIK